MFKLSRRSFCRHLASAVLLTSCLLPLVRPAEAARRFNPNSPKGTFVGTFASSIGPANGTLTIKITADKPIRFVPTARNLAGTFQWAGRKAQKFTGTYLIDARRVGLSSKDARGSTTHTAIQMDLSADGTALVGGYSTNVDGDDGGSVTLTRQ